MSDPGELIVTDTGGDKPGPTLSLRYDPGINVEVGRVTRDYSKSPQAEVVIDVDKKLAPERPRRVFRGRLGLLSRSGIKACVDTCKRRVEGMAWAGIGGAQLDRLLESRDEYTAERVFWVPPEARWANLQNQATRPDIASLIDDAILAVERRSLPFAGLRAHTGDLRPFLWRQGLGPSRTALQASAPLAFGG